MHLCSEHVVYILCCRQESRPGVPPSHHQRSPSPFLLDSFSLHSTHLSLSTSPASQSSYTVLTHHPVWLDCFSACVWMCSCYRHLLSSTFVFCARDTSTVLPFVVSRFCILFCFSPVGVFVILKTCLPALGPRHLFILGAFSHRPVTAGHWR